MRMRSPAGFAACLLAAATTLAPGVAGAAATAAHSTFPGAASVAAPAGDILADAAVEDLIRLALADRQVDAGSAAVELTGMSARPSLPAGARLAIERLSYQPVGRRFTAVLAAQAPGMPTQRLTVVGRLREEVQVPVLARRIQAGEVIAASDLRWLPVRDRGLPGNTVYDPGDLVGLSPRRSLAPGVPVVAADLKRPVAIAKGALVTLVLSAPNLQLTARGRALEDGAVGQSVRVANAQSRSVVAGVVLANGQVAVEDGALAPVREARR
jgi:flagellar basal body P-ring formation protein FlgA